MLPHFYVDDVQQIFLVDGNYHLIMGTVSGEVSEKGEDMRYQCLKLTIPKNRFEKMLSDLAGATSALASPDAIPQDNETPESISEKTEEFLGAPLVFPR